jgi:hypothetical protein
LLAGDLSGLTKAQHEALRRLARSKPIVDLATAMNVDPFRIAVTLLAETTQNRVAQRLGRRLLKDTPALLSLLQGRMQDRSWRRAGEINRVSSTGPSEPKRSPPPVCMSSPISLARRRLIAHTPSTDAISLSIARW